MVFVRACAATKQANEKDWRQNNENDTFSFERGTTAIGVFR
jgi:hypothetical protein